MIFFTLSTEQISIRYEVSFLEIFAIPCKSKDDAITPIPSNFNKYINSFFRCEENYRIMEKKAEGESHD